MIWPLCAFFVGRKLPFQQALIWGVLVPYLFLPEAFAIKLPALPDLDKTVAISIGVLIIFAINRSSLKSAPAETEAPLLRLLLRVGIIMMFSAPFLTVLNNQEPLQFGPTSLPGLQIKDGVSQTLSALLAFVPYYFARRYLASPETHRKILVAFVIMGLIYSVLMLVEMRLSPQLHRWIYGFHQHSFLQHIRDGYRPMMFLYHGLFVGFFVCVCVIAALGLWKAGQGVKWLIAAIWLTLILFMSNNLGATAICVLVVVVYLGTGRWIQILFAMCIGFMVFLFPIFRGTGLVPVEQISAAAAAVSEERSRSLNYRLRNEDISLARALEKPVTGWGQWGRNHVYNERGEMITIQEGVWIQAITENGWYGYLGLFSVLTLPAMFVIGVWRRKEIPPETFALMAITTGNLIYMIPTTCLTPAGWVMFGALAGFMLTRTEANKAEADVVAPDAPVSHYTRFASNRTPASGRRARRKSIRAGP
ncbi:O-antigen ligase family protein [Primorskyibacter marinus]|uniref:O-antigen ligase family protein n=1 Tax=Primorskyibacter flagellatus TaxID=1387277 RepID=UPI000E309FB0